METVDFYSFLLMPHISISLTSLSTCIGTPIRYNIKWNKCWLLFQFSSTIYDINHLFWNIYHFLLTGIKMNHIKNLYFTSINKVLFVPFVLFVVVITPKLHISSSRNISSKSSLKSYSVINPSYFPLLQRIYQGTNVYLSIK